MQVSLAAQLVKNPPAMWETWIWSLGWEDPLEKGKATHSERVGHDWEHWKINVAVVCISYRLLQIINIHLLKVTFYKTVE